MHAFTENVQSVRDFIAKVRADGGGDFPEDVSGGMQLCLDLDWLEKSHKEIFFIADAPEHGRRFHKHHDSHPNSPHNLELEGIMTEFAKRRVYFRAFRLDSQND